MSGEDLTPRSMRYDVLKTFVAVRSEFFRAARSPQWLTDPQKPTDLPDDDPEIFSLYVSLVYFGMPSLWPNDNVESEDIIQKDEAMQEHDNKSSEYTGADDADTDSQVQTRFQSLVKIYLLADKLHDLGVMNMIVDEIIRFSDLTDGLPELRPVTVCYESTVDASLLHALLRDYWVHEASKRTLNYFRKAYFPPDFYRDVAFECLRIRTEMEENGTVSPNLYMQSQLRCGQMSLSPT
ncbi:hypothetical protein Q7P37_000827 [Cladosporium fusiforme]